MRQLPSRLRRLDDALADLPLDEPMLLTELDGFLHGVLVCPDLIMPAEWLRNVWGSDEGGIAPFDDPADVQWFVDAVMARYNEIVRDLGRGKPKPIFDVDERNGDVLWELWLDGFAEAMELRPESWAFVEQGEDEEAADVRPKRRWRCPERPSASSLSLWACETKTCASISGNQAAVIFLESRSPE